MLAGQGSGTTADILRFPRRALETHPHQQPHRKHLRHRAAANRENKKMLAMDFKLILSAKRK